MPLRRLLHRRLLVAGLALAVLLGALSPATVLHAQPTSEWQGPVHAKVVAAADPAGRVPVLPAIKPLDLPRAAALPRQAGALDGDRCRMRLRLARLSPPPAPWPLRHRTIPDDADRPA